MFDARKVYFATHNFSFVLLVFTLLIQNPYRIKPKIPFYNLWNRFVNFIELQNFQNYFLDFDKNEFEKRQAKMIFDEIGSLLDRKEFSNASKHLNEHLLNVIKYFIFVNRSQISFRIYNNNFLKSYRENKKVDLLKDFFKAHTSDWKIVHARTLWDNSFPALQEISYAQMTLKYRANENEDRYIVFERKLSNNISFLSWKVFIPDHKDYI